MSDSVSDSIKKQTRGYDPGPSEEIFYYAGPDTNGKAFYYRAHYTCSKMPPAIAVVPVWGDFEDWEYMFYLTIYRPDPEEAVELPPAIKALFAKNV